MTDFEKRYYEYKIIKYKNFLKILKKIKPTVIKIVLMGWKGLSVQDKEVNSMDDNQIIELYFARNEQAIKETDAKYGKLCFSVANRILENNEDSEECVNDT